MRRSSRCHARLALCDTPLKMNMEPQNHSVVEENSLPQVHAIRFHVNLPGVSGLCTLDHPARTRLLVLDFPLHLSSASESLVRTSRQKARCCLPFQAQVWRCGELQIG